MNNKYENHQEKRTLQQPWCFFQSKGIELSDGSYSARIQQGCNLLSDAINATRNTVSQTKVKVDDALDQLRQTIHDGTAPNATSQTKSKSRQATPRGKRPAAAEKKSGRKA